MYEPIIVELIYEFCIFQLHEELEVVVVVAEEEEDSREDINILSFIDIL